MGRQPKIAVGSVVEVWRFRRWCKVCVVEDRGKLGPGGEQVWRVEQKFDPAEYGVKSQEFEVLESNIRKVKHGSRRGA